MGVCACALGGPAPTPTPLPTATQIPLSEIDLQPYLYEQGDLPAMLQPGQVRDFAPEMFARLPKAENTIYMQFANNGDTAGGVAIFLYGDESLRNSAYQIIKSGFGADAVEIKEVGEKAAGVSMSLVFDFLDITFQSCTAVVHIRMSGTKNLDTGISYGRRLEKRLAPIICR